MLSLILLLGLIGTSCISGRDFNKRLSSIVKPYLFSRVSWELKTILGIVKQETTNPKIEDEIKLVTDYFSIIEQIRKLKSEIAAIKNGSKSGDSVSLNEELIRLQQQRADSENIVEDILERQLSKTLTEQGVFNPFEKFFRLKFSFPPLDFKLEKPPHLLIISPRERIESVREITLRQGMNVAEMESVEADVDKLGVSSLVAELGGFGGTYPTFVTNEASLSFTLDAAAEEWLHLYLAFKPLGFLYFLDLTGLKRNYEIATLNETVASMVSKEIGSTVIEKYYPGAKEDEKSQDKTKGFDFNKEMREIRKTVDSLLAEGKIEPAEKFMAEKRQYLAANGHYIRKLNQAYFAFHGTYADSPTSISPIGDELRALRAKSISLKEFLEKVATMTSRQDLINYLK